MKLDSILLLILNLLNQSMSKGRQHTILILKLSVVCGILIFIYFKLQDQQYSIDQLIIDLKRVITSQPYLFGLVLLLMPLNWGIETLKWQYMAKKVVPLTWWQSLLGVLTGLSLSFITPHGLGDYVGRIMLLENEERGRLGGAILLGRVCQMSVTIIFGFIGLSYFVDMKWLLIFIFSTGAVSFIAYKLWSAKHLYLLNKLPSKIKYFLEIISQFNQKEVGHIFSLSFIRYVVFTIQLMVLLQIFNTSLTWYNSFMGTTWIFLAKSVIPTFNFLSDLGVREFSAIYFFERQPVELPMILVATLLLWIINILIPTLIGTPLVFKMKINAK